VRYVVYLEEEPELGAYRLHHGPRAGLAPVFICPFIVVTGASGAMYNSMRGVQGNEKGSVMNMGTYRLNGVLDEQCPMLFPWSDAPVSEPYWVVEDRDAVSYASAHFRLDCGVSDYRWEDAGGRLDVRARRLGQVCTFWVPEQPDWPLHTCGIVSSISNDRPVKRSWNYTEFFPLNWSAVADYQAAHTALYGKPPSFRKLMQGAKVDDTQRLVFDPGTKA
jgi:hypothetical protein